MLITSRLHSLAALLALLGSLVPIATAGESEDPGKPPGDTSLREETYPEATPEQLQRVVDALSRFCEPAAGQCFQEVIDGPNCCLVDTGEAASGLADATTIGLNLSSPPSDLSLAMAAAHEKEHWERASQPRDKDGDGSLDQADPDDKDPLTEPDTDGDDEVDNPCGPLEHAKMAVANMNKARATLDCPGYTDDEDKKDWCDRWEQMKHRIRDATTDAASLGCDEAKAGPGLRVGKTADQLADDLGLDVSKPDACK